MGVVLVLTLLVLMRFPPHDDHRPPLSPPRFRLATLMWGVAGACVLVAVLTSLSAYGVFAAILFVLAVGAHIIGARLGHILRDHGSRRERNSPGLAERYRSVDPTEFAPATKLGQRRRLGRLILILTVTWTVLGAAGGAVLMLVVNGRDANVANVASGAAAFAVLGAIWGFALAAFMQEFVGAIAQALRGK